MYHILHFWAIKSPSCVTRITNNDDLHHTPPLHHPFHDTIAHSKYVSHLTSPPLTPSADSPTVAIKEGASSFSVPLTYALLIRKGVMKKSLIIVGLMIGLLILVGAKYDYLLEMGDKTVKADECAKCHKTIHKEWSQSYHAKAYVNDPFKQSTKDYQEQACLPCHASQEIAEENALKLRPVHTEEGINCTTCHLRNNMIYGPYKLVAKHPSEQDEAMLTAEFCAGCHMPTYQEWQVSGSQKQCQECHMPRVERKSVQGFPIAALVPKRMVGQHIQMYEELLKGAASITGEITAGSIKISLTNKAADHNMPTGKYGDYRIVLTTTVEDPEGKEVFTQQEVFATQKNTGIPFQKTVLFEYPVSLDTGKASATLTYQVPGRPPVSMATWSAPLGGGN